jgi:hypothetical protein
MVIDRRHDHSFRIPARISRQSRIRRTHATTATTDKSAQWRRAPSKRGVGPRREGFQTYAPLPCRMDAAARMPRNFSVRSPQMATRRLWLAPAR